MAAGEVLGEIWAVAAPSATDPVDLRIFVRGVTTGRFSLAAGGGEPQRILTAGVPMSELTLQNLGSWAIELGNDRGLVWGQGLRVPPNTLLSGGVISPIGSAVSQLERFTGAGLPALGNAGRLVQLTDYDRSLWIDDGSKWRSITGRRFDVTAFCAVADNGVTDNGPAFNAAVNALAAAGGGVLVIPPSTLGSWYGFTTPWVLDSIRVGIRVEGGVGTTTSSPELRWLGAAGSGSLVRGDSMASFHFCGISFSYSNAAYDGDLVKGAHSGIGVDIANVVFEDCHFGGVGVAGARSLLSLSAIIISVIRGCKFNGALVGIRLADPAYGALSQYSDAVTIDGQCTWNNCGKAIRLGGSNFGTYIRENTFEPTTAGTKSGVDTEPGIAGQILNFVYEGNWNGDCNASGGGSWLSLTSPANRGIKISGNNFDTIRDGEHAIVLGTGSGAEISGNSFVRVAGGTTGRSVSFATAFFEGVDYHGNFASGPSGGQPGCVPDNLQNAIDFHANDHAFTSEHPPAYNTHDFRYEPLNTAAINPVLTGTGAIAANAGGRGQIMTTGVTNPSSASQRINLSGSGAGTTLVSRIRRIAFDCYIANTLASANCYLYLTEESVNVAPSAIARHLGIKNLNGVISFTTADGAVEETTNVSAFIVAATQQLFVITFDGVTARLYIDGVLRATHVTRVPAAGAFAVLRLFIDNNASVNARQMVFYAAEVTLVR